MPGLEALEGDLPSLAAATAEAIERTLIELVEAQSMVTDLKRHANHDGAQLESVEARLFALRAAARKYDCLPELLTDTYEKFKADLALCDADTDSLASAQAAEAKALATWNAKAERISAARRKSAKGLASAVMKELAPLQLGPGSVPCCLY